jgi:hypothetical protein
MKHPEIVLGTIYVCHTKLGGRRVHLPKLQSSVNFEKHKSSIKLVIYMILSSILQTQTSNLVFVLTSVHGFNKVKKFPNLFSEFDVHNRYFTAATDNCKNITYHETYNSVYF